MSSAWRTGLEKSRFYGKNFKNIFKNFLILKNFFLFLLGFV